MVLKPVLLEMPQNRWCFAVLKPRLLEIPQNWWYLAVLKPGLLDMPQNRWCFAVLKPRLLEIPQNHQKDLQRWVQPEAVVAAVADGRLAGRDRMGC